MNYEVLSIINPIKLEFTKIYEIDPTPVKREMSKILKFIYGENKKFKIYIRANCIHREKLNYDEELKVEFGERIITLGYFTLLNRINEISNEQFEPYDSNPYIRNFKKMDDYIQLIVKLCFKYARNETKKELNTIFYNDVSEIILDYDVPYSFE